MSAVERTRVGGEFSVRASRKGLRTGTIGQLLVRLSVRQCTHLTGKCAYARPGRVRLYSLRLFVTGVVISPCCGLVHGYNVSPVLPFMRFPLDLQL